MANHLHELLNHINDSLGIFCPHDLGYPTLLVPKDILRHLPIANDWSEVSSVVLENEEIRAAVNAMLGDITKATVTEKKHAIRNVALKSLDNFREILEALINNSSHYDPNEDIFGYYAFRKALSMDNAFFKGKVDKPKKQNTNELLRVVRDIIAHFQKMVENNNLWELLWHGNKPRRERAAQLLFFAIAESFCKANDLDISPEMNAGGGPVDFKFSKGYKKRVVVELKLSKGTVVHGYKKQLEIYKKASDTDAGMFIVVDVGGLKGKLQQIKILQKRKIDAGEAASEIFSINAMRKKSASKAI